MEKMRKITYAKAICEALTEEMHRDENTILFAYEASTGGVYKTMTGLTETFGRERVIDCPISENVEIGMATGAAFYGMRPIIKIMMSDFSLVALDPIVMHMAKFMYLSAGQIKQMPLVIRMPITAGGSMGAHHCNALYAAYANFPGLKIVYPTNPYDAKGMLKAAIRDNNPVLFFEPASQFPKRGEVPEEDYIVPLGKCATVREGTDLTIAAFGLSVVKAKAACEELEKQGVSAELIDIRSLKPLDLDTIVGSVKKTGKLLLVDEAHESYGITGEIAFRVQQVAMSSLKAPVARVAMPDVSIPVGPTMEKMVFVSAEKIVQAAQKLL